MSWAMQSGVGGFGRRKRSIIIFRVTLALGRGKEASALDPFCGRDAIWRRNFSTRRGHNDPCPLITCLPAFPGFPRGLSRWTRRALNGPVGDTSAHAQNGKGKNNRRDFRVLCLHGMLYLSTIWIDIRNWPKRIGK